MAQLPTGLDPDTEVGRFDRDELRTLLLYWEPVDLAEPARTTRELINRLLAAATGSAAETGSVATSVRVPRAVHEVASEVVANGWVPSMTDLVSAGLRTRLGLLALAAGEQQELDAVHEALADHYAEHPEAKPSLAMVVQAAASLEDHPAANHPDLIAAAISDLGGEAYVEDVLAWVRGALSKPTTGQPTPDEPMVDADGEVDTT